MRRIFTLFVAAIMTASLFAQAPQKVSYQAVIRNSSDQLVTNQLVGMQISILQGSASGTAVYVETQNPTTNDNGLITLEIGTGTTSDDFSAINWTSGPYFIKTEIDPAGGTSYTISGTSQILSVPYALHAETAESITGTYSETDPVYASSQAAYITATDITNLSNLSGTNTGDQDLSSYLTSESDPIYSASQAANITAADITNLSNLSGTNTGDQDLSSYLTSESDPIYSASQAANITAADITNLSNLSGTNTGDQDLSGYLTSESDPVYSASQAANITAADITNLSNLSGTNTGDQDLSGYLTSESDPVYSAWDKDYADLINTPTAGTGIDISGNVISAIDDYYIGQELNGGIIYYLYKNSNGEQHGLIVSTIETTSLMYQNTGTDTGADSPNDGAANTALLTDSPAADWIASNFDSNWYLPSPDELSLLWHNRYLVNTALSDGGYTELSAFTDYWSSMEVSTANAFYFRFNLGHIEYGPKTSDCSVRAVRSF